MSETRPASSVNTEPGHEHDRSTLREALSLRALAIGAVLIPINIVWMVHVEYVRYSDNVSTSALFFNAIALLIFLSLINMGISRLWTGRGLSRCEMLTIYVMVVVATGLAGHDQMQILFSTIHYAVARAGPENGWVDTVLPYLPQHLVPSAGEAVRDLYRGGSTLYTPSHIFVWLRPLAWWSAFVFALVWVMMCLSSIFRRQWQAERLTYPIAEIPLQITDPQTRLLGNKLFWIAFALAAGLRCSVIAHLLFPSIPELSLNVRYLQISTSPPWSHAGSIPICFFPFAFGLCFFLPAQVAFSVWFFFWLSRLELVAAGAFGTGQVTGFPYIAEQGVGAAIGIAIAVIWYARSHLKAIWRHVFTRAPIDDKNEPMPYRTAFWGLVLGCVFLVAFAVYAGMRLPTAIIYMSIFLLLVLVTARLRAEVGLPTIEMFLVGSDRILCAAAGDLFWTRHELTAMSLFFWLSRTHRQFPMSSQVDGLQIANRGGLRLNAMTVAILVASALTVIAAFWAYLHVMYQTGYASAKYNQMILREFGSRPWEALHLRVVSPSPPDPSRMCGYGSGAMIALFLSAMRAKFIWWPFHPAGYLAASSWGLSRMWVPLFGSWLIKVSLLRYGGLKAYKKAIPFFIGLIAGEFVIGMLATLLGFFGIELPASSGIGGL